MDKKHRCSHCRKDKHECNCPCTLIKPEIEQKIKVKVNAPIGATGPAGITGPPGVTGAPGPSTMTLILQSSKTINQTVFLGFNHISDSYIRNTFIIPQDAIITGLTYSIRDTNLAPGETTTAQIYFSPPGFYLPVPSEIIATIDSPNTFSYMPANVSINAFTLLSVQITTGGATLSEGVAVTISLITH